jgi:hypothetical protein
MLLASPLLLLLPPLLLRALPLRSDRDAPWSGWVDGSLALLLGLAVAVVGTAWVGPVALIQPSDAVDYQGVCETVTAIRALDFAAITRQPGAALLPGLLAIPLGLLDGLSLASLLSAAATGGLLYLWGRILYGRAAGVAAAVLMCAVHPVASMARQLHFYPEAAVSFLACAVAGTAALRWRSPRSYLALGLAAGWALMCDHPGLFYAGAGLMIGLVLAGLDGWRRGWRRGLLVLALLLGPVLLSYGLTRPMNQGAPFESKLAVFQQDITGNDSVYNPSAPQPGDGALVEALGAFVDAGPHPDDPRFGYRWGWCTPVSLLRTAASVLLMQRIQPVEGFVNPFDLERRRGEQLDPWLPVLALCLPLTLVALRRRPWEALGLLVLLAPFALSLRSVYGSQIFPRLLLSPMIPFSLLMGVAWAWAAHRPPLESGQRRWGWLWTPLINGLVLALLVAGLPPTWLARDAAWRAPGVNANQPFMVQKHAVRSLEDPSVPAHTEDDPQGVCRALVAEDIQAGHPPHGRFYPQAVQRALDFDGRWEGPVPLRVPQDPHPEP